jgi:serine/threonine protein kinase
MSDAMTSGSYDPLKVDVFSLGATVWEMAQHEPPFAAVQDVTQITAQWPPLDNPDDFTSAFHDFLRLCSMVAPSRPSPEDLLHVRIALYGDLTSANRLLFRRLSSAARLLGGTLSRSWTIVD